MHQHLLSSMYVSKALYSFLAIVVSSYGPWNGKVRRFATLTLNKTSNRMRGMIHTPGPLHTFALNKAVDACLYSYVVSKVYTLSDMKYGTAQRQRRKRTQLFCDL